MRPSSPRVPPISPEDFTPEQAAMAKGHEHLNFARMLVNHPALYKVFVPFGEKMMRGSELPTRDREILLLRTLELCGEGYEAPHHVAIARAAGLTDAEIEAARTGGTGLVAFDRALVKAAEELVGEHCLSNATWAKLSERYSRVQMIDLVFLVGDYTMLSMVTSSLGMQIETEAAHP